MPPADDSSNDPFPTDRRLAFTKLLHEIFNGPKDEGDEPERLPMPVAIMEHLRRLRRPQLWTVESQTAQQFFAATLSSLILRGIDAAQKSSNIPISCDLNEQPTLTLPADFRGEPADLVLISPLMPTREALEQDVDLHFYQKDLPQEVPALVGDFNDSTEGNAEVPAKRLKEFGIYPNAKTQRLEVWTERNLEEDALVVMVVLGDLDPVPVILSALPESPHLLGGSVPIPQEFGDRDRHPTVQVRVYEVLDRELNRLAPEFASACLANRRIDAFPLTRLEPGKYGFNISPADRSFIAANPRAIVALRVAAAESGVSR